MGQLKKFEVFQNTPSNIRVMKPIGKYIIIKTIEEEIKHRQGFYWPSKTQPTKIQNICYKISSDVDVI